MSKATIPQARLEETAAVNSSGVSLGFYSGGFDVMKRNIYNNYYKTSGKAYGAKRLFTWKPWFAKAN